MTKIQTIIGIAGASGAGKSVFAEQLCERISESQKNQNGGSQIATILNEDNYYRDRSDLEFADRELINYDHPDALEHSLLAEHLKLLRNGDTVQIPQYNYAEHNRRSETRILEPTRILIVEGILILHDPEIRSHLDLAIFVDVPLDICLIRRLERDTRERGRSIDSVLNQYLTTVRPMFHQFIRPSRAFADIIVPRGGENQNALDVLYSHMEGILHKAHQAT